MIVSNILPENIRFGFSSARECLRGIRVLLHPAKHAEQMPWVRSARRRLSSDVRAAIEAFRFFFDGNAETFPFIWDEIRNDSFEREIRRLRSNLPAYRNAVVMRLSEQRLVSADELRAMRRTQWYRAAADAHVGRHPTHAAALEQFVASPARSLQSFCAMLEAFHAHVFAPEWSPIHARLLADIRMREKMLRNYGPTALLRTLSPAISAHRSGRGARLDLGRTEATIAFDAGSALVLTPSFFCWPGHEAYVLRTPGGARCTIAYPVPPLTARAGVFADRSTLAGGFQALGDPTRLRIMELLNVRELSTRELAAYLSLAEPLVSRHLRVLLRAELVQQRRSSYFVMYGVRRDTLRRITVALAPLH